MIEKPSKRFTLGRKLPTRSGSVAGPAGRHHAYCHRRRLVMANAVTQRGNFGPRFAETTWLRRQTVALLHQRELLTISLTAAGRTFRAELANRRLTRRGGTCRQKN